MVGSDSSGKSGALHGKQSYFILSCLSPSLLALLTLLVLHNSLKEKEGAVLVGFKPAGLFLDGKPPPMARHQTFPQPIAPILRRRVQVEAGLLPRVGLCFVPFSSTFESRAGGRGGAREGRKGPARLPQSRAFGRKRRKRPKPRERGGGLERRSGRLGGEPAVLLDEHAIRRTGTLAYLGLVC